MCSREMTLVPPRGRGRDPGCAELACAECLDTQCLDTQCLRCLPRARDLPSQSKEALGKEMEFLESVEAKYGASAQATPQSANPAMESAAAMQSVGESMSVEEAASAKGEAPFQAGAGTFVTEGWGKGGCTWRRRGRGRAGLLARGATRPLHAVPHRPLANRAPVPP